MPYLVTDLIVRSSTMKKVFYSTALICLLLITFFVGYYFLYLLPSHNDAVLEFEREKYQDEQEKIELEETNAYLEGLEREANLQDCLSGADADYDANWAKTCASVAENKEFEKDSCTSNGYTWCDTIQIDYSEDCGLPTEQAENVNGYHEDAEDECIQLYGS